MFLLSFSAFGGTSAGGFVALLQKNDFFFGKEVSAYRSNCRLIINIFAVKQQKNQIFLGVHNKNDYIYQHPNGLNNRI
ncbi:hypothetical protein HMPREF3226_00608 [Prevotella corporis]|uniref:Uncharacterized protein n=1 Tax=Prevotella corporis TaxID=28128 RepID=A0A133QJ24_9BACT|nr:hypothetical protein HMPREF3226_00608 [Prevotella corporis]